MAGYSKLDCGIVDSTIWCAPDDVFRTWIAMLAKTNAHGYVRVAIPAMAKLVGVTIERMEEISKILSSPDPYSRTQEHDGRRLEKVDGGWQILNYAKYREGLKQPDATAAERKRRQRTREREALSRNNPAECHGSTVTVTKNHAQAEAYAEAYAEALNTQSPPPPLKGGVSANDEAFNRFWDVYPKKVSKGDAKKAWDTGKCHKQIDAILASLEKHRLWTEWTKEGGRYIPYPATWLRAMGWENETENTNVSRDGMAVGEDKSWD